MAVGGGGDDDDDGGGMYGPRPNPHWDRLAEQRLNDLHVQIREVRREINALWMELRKEIRSGDNREAMIRRLDEKAVDLLARIESIRRDTREVADDVRKAYVTKVEFDPIRKAILAVISAVCLAVVAALTQLVLK